MMYGFLRKSLCIFAVLLCICAFSFNFLPLDSLAAEVTEEDTTTETVHPDQESAPIQINVVSPSEGEYTLTSVDTHSTRITAADSTGFKAVVLGLFGDYEMITKEYTYTSNNGYTSKQVTTESDFPWIISAGIFTVVLYSLFRMLGGVLCGRK